MRVLFMGDTGLSIAQVSMGIYDASDKTLWFSINDNTLEKSQLIVEGVVPSVGEQILQELYTTGMYDFSRLGLHIEYF